MVTYLTSHYFAKELPSTGITLTLRREVQFYLTVGK